MFYLAWHAGHENTPEKPGHLDSQFAVLAGNCIVRAGGAIDDWIGTYPVDKKATKLVIELLNAELKHIAFDANLFDQGLAVYPKARWASERRQQVQAALEQIQNARRSGQSVQAALPKRQQLEMFPE